MGLAGFSLAGFFLQACFLLTWVGLTGRWPELKCKLPASIDFLTHAKFLPGVIMSLVQQSFGKLSRLSLMVAFSFCLFSGLTAKVASAQDVLTIGSTAPALDIEH